MTTPGWRHPERLCKPPFPIQVGDALCHPKSPAAIGFLTNTSQVNRTVLIYIHTKGKQMGLFLMVLGFMWWWPLGLIILAALIANGRIGYRRRLQFAGSGPTGDWDHVTRMDRIGEKADRVPANQRGSEQVFRGGGTRRPAISGRRFP